MTFTIRIDVCRVEEFQNTQIKHKYIDLTIADLLEITEETLGETVMDMIKVLVGAD
jgi:hypothetical protein